MNTTTENQTFIDHDMLVRVDENIKNLITEFSRFKDVTSNIEIRLRLVEDSMTKLSPIPSVSHEAVLNSIESLNKRVDTLFSNKGEVLASWKTISFATGFIGALIGAAYYIFKLNGH